MQLYTNYYYSTQPNITQKSLCISTKAPMQRRKAHETQTTKQNAENLSERPTELMQPHLNANHTTDATHQSRLNVTQLISLFQIV